SGGAGGDSELVRDDHVVESGVRQLNIVQRQRGRGCAGEVRAGETPLIFQRLGTGGGDVERDASAQSDAQVLRLACNGRRQRGEALARNARVVNRQQLAGGQGAVVEAHFVERTVEIKVARVGRAGCVGGIAAMAELQRRGGVEICERRIRAAQN